MRKTLSILVVCIAFLGICGIGAEDASGFEPGELGIRAGVGTDINLGLAYGFGVNYLINLGDNALEVGPVIYGGHFEEDSTEGIHDYHEETSLMVIGVMANYLYNYSMDNPGFYQLLGIGIGVIKVEWEETSPTDTSLGTPLPGGGSMQSEEGSVAGTVLNLGLGSTFEGGFDLRAEIPIIIIAGGPGEASAVVPTFTVTVGYRF